MRNSPKRARKHCRSTGRTYERLIRFDCSSKNTSKMGRNLYNGPTVQYHAATEEDLARYEDFLGSIDKIEIYDDTLYYLVNELR